MLRRGIMMLLTVLCGSFNLHGARSYRPKGVNVREKAKQLVTLLKDEERLREERIHALKTKEKMAQTSSGEADHYHEPLRHAAQHLLKTQHLSRPGSFSRRFIPSEAENNRGGQMELLHRLLSAALPSFK